MRVSGQATLLSLLFSTVATNLNTGGVPYAIRDRAFRSKTGLGVKEGIDQ